MLSQHKQTNERIDEEVGGGGDGNMLSGTYLHMKTYRIAGNFRGRKLSQIGKNEDFAKKTFVEQFNQSWALT